MEKLVSRWSSLWILVLLIACVAPACGTDDDGGGEGEGEGEGGEGEGEGGEGEGEGEGEGGEGEGEYQTFLDICLYATAGRREVHCSGDDQLCHDQRQFLEWSGGVCLEEMTAWWNCVGTSAIYQDCSDDCIAGPSVDCQVAYCQDHQDRPECDCTFHGGPGCPPTPPPA